MEVLQLFTSLLKKQPNKPSVSTVKNYTSDIRSFSKWFEKEKSHPITISDISQEVIDEFLIQSNLSPRSKGRVLASLKKMYSLFSQEGIIKQNVFRQETPVEKDMWKLREFKHSLFKQKASPLTIKNYMSDLAHFTKWVDAEYGIQKHLNISEDIINQYKNTLIHILNLSPSSVNRKLSSIRKYGEFVKVPEAPSSSAPLQIPRPIPHTPAMAALLGTSTLQSLEEFRIKDSSYSKIPPVRLIQRISRAYAHFEELLAFQTSKLFKPHTSAQAQKASPLDIFIHLRHTRPQWYKKYHALPYVNQIHISILSLFCAGLLVYGYAHYFDTPPSADVLGITQQNKRVLVYSGKLSTSNNTPITNPTEITFSIYPHPSANDSVLWKETHEINPNSDGSFTVQLGRQRALSDSFFTDNQSLYLGMKVGNESELVPRQRLANVAYASDSMLLDGMSPITKDPSKPQNSILALDSSGNLVIGGSANPVFQASGGDITITGSTTILTTNSDSGGNVVIEPDGSGVVDIRKPIVNDSQEASASGSVDFADEVSIATESAGSVLTVQNTGEIGSILSLMSRNVTRMTVDNSGNVGIGTTSPSQLVHLANTNSPTLRIENLLSGTKLDISSFETLASIGTSTQTALGFTTDKLVRMHISPTGNVGIGTTAPTALLDINGSASISGSLTFTGGARNIQTANNNNLIIGGNTTGNLILQPLNGNGFVGVANNSPEFKLDILDSQASRSAMQIFNASNSTDADGLIIKLGNNTSSVHKDNQFITFQTQGLGTVGSISGTVSGSGISYNTTNADFAEYIKKDPNESIRYGSLVCLTDTGTVSSCTSTNTRIVGVTSESPGFVGGRSKGNHTIEVGLVGQIETFVSTENGQIQAGDPITVSSITGVGKKATQAGMIVGRALESYTSSTPGKVLVLIQPSWHEPTMSLVQGEIRTTSLPEVQLDKKVYDQVASAIAQSTYSVNQNNQVIDTIVSYSQATIGKIRAGLIETQNLIVSGTLATRNIVAEQLHVTTDNLFVNGQSLSEYITSVVSTGQFKNSQVKTNIISPLSEDGKISMHLDDTHVTIQNASGSAVTSLDNQGNATFSGSLTAGNITSQGDASIAGTLTVDSLRAKTIEGLEDTVHSIASKFNREEELTPDFETIDISTFSAEFALFRENLLSLGTTTLREASIIDSLSIGSSFIIGPESIDVLDADLQIQPLRQGGVSFLGGLMALDRDGNLTVSGDANFAKNVKIQGGLFANIISPLPGTDLDIFLGNKNGTESAQLRVVNDSKTPVLTINNKGDVYSSGSAHFVGDLVASGSAFLSKLNILSQDAQAVSENEMVASSSAGTAVLKAYKREVTIKSPYVKSKSLIYITPSTNTENQALYLLRQSEEGSFTVGLSDILPKDIYFNWIIIN